MTLSLDEGRKAVTLARKTLEDHVKGSPAPEFDASGVFAEKRGVFVTLNSVTGGSKMLRGCIGYPEPIKPLAEAIRDVTVYASEDPRFPHTVTPEELDGIVVEVSVLTLPRELAVPDRKDLPLKVRIGVDGLIISNRFTSGLLLPQVATEQGWDQETFLSEACAKAGLPLDAWLDRETKVQSFQAEIFSETEPRGRVARVDPETRN